ncbi:hypothetical protein ACJX0J_041876, partial [Zea mays]
MAHDLFWVQHKKWICDTLGKWGWFSVEIVVGDGLYEIFFKVDKVLKDGRWIDNDSMGYRDGDDKEQGENEDYSKKHENDSFPSEESDHNKPNDGALNINGLPLRSGSRLLDTCWYTGCCVAYLDFISEDFHDMVSSIWQHENTGETIRALRQYLRGWAKNSAVLNNMLRVITKTSLESNTHDIPQLLDQMRKIRIMVKVSLHLGVMLLFLSFENQFQRI